MCCELKFIIKVNKKRKENESKMVNKKSREIDNKVIITEINLFGVIELIMLWWYKFKAD